MQEDSSPKAFVIPGIHPAIESSADSIPHIPLGDLIDLWVSILSMQYHTKVVDYSCRGKEDNNASMPAKKTQKKAPRTTAKPLTVTYEDHNNDPNEEDNRNTAQHILRRLGDHCALYHQRYFTAEDIEELQTSKRLLKSDHTDLWDYHHGLPQSVLCSDTAILCNESNTPKVTINFITKKLRKIFTQTIFNDANRSQAKTSLSNQLFEGGVSRIASSSEKPHCDFRLPNQDCVNFLELGIINLKRHKLTMTFSGGVIVVFERPIEIENSNAEKLASNTYYFSFYSILEDIKKYTKQKKIDAKYTPIVQLFSNTPSRGKSLSIIIYSADIRCQIKQILKKDVDQNFRLSLSDLKKIPKNPSAVVKCHANRAFELAGNFFALNLYDVQHSTPVDASCLLSKFSINSADTKRLVVTGDAGSGKSTLCHFLVNQWRSDSTLQSDIELVITIPLCRMTAQYFPPRESNYSIIEVLLRCLKWQFNSEEYTAFRHNFDGLLEIYLKQLLEQTWAGRFWVETQNSQPAVKQETPGFFSRLFGGSKTVQEQTSDVVVPEKMRSKAVVFLLDGADELNRDIPCALLEALSLIFNHRFTLLTSAYSVKELVHLDFLGRLKPVWPGTEQSYNILGLKNEDVHIFLEKYFGSVSPRYIETDKNQLPSTLIAKLDPSFTQSVVMLDLISLTWHSFGDAFKTTSAGRKSNLSVLDHALLCSCMIHLKRFFLHLARDYSHEEILRFCRTHIMLMEYFAFSLIENDRTCDSLEVAIDYLSEHILCTSFSSYFNFSALLSIGLIQQVDDNGKNLLPKTQGSYRFSHKYLIDYFCARYLVSCLRHETELSSSDSISVVRKSRSHRWHSKKYPTLKEFLQKKDNVASLGPVFEIMNEQIIEMEEDAATRERMLVIFKSIDHITLNLTIFKEKFNELASRGYKFKLQRLSHNKLRVTCLHTPDTERSTIRQLALLEGSLKDSLAASNFQAIKFIYQEKSDTNEIVLESDSFEHFETFLASLRAASSPLHKISGNHPFFKNNGSPFPDETKAATEDQYIIECHLQ